MRQNAVTSEWRCAAISVVALAGTAIARSSTPVATEVVSVAELSRAILDRAEHILITEHLTVFQLGEDTAVLPLNPRTKSIQVRFVARVFVAFDRRVHPLSRVVCYVKSHLHPLTSRRL